MFGLSTVKKKKAKIQQIIAEIHNSFETAADRALEEAREILGLKLPVFKHKDEVTILKELGFAKTKLVVADKAQQEVLDAAKAQKRTAEQRAEVVQKWAVKYPQYKFIFMDQVVAICEKYGLVCGSVDRYIGDVPKKNIHEIANFKVKDEDIYFHKYYKRYFRSDREMDLQGDKHSFVPTDEMMRHKQRFEPQPRSLYRATDTMEGYKLFSDNRMYRAEMADDGYDFEKVPLYICAPKSDMKISENTRQKGVFLQDIPDPIVLHYVKDGFLIVSKWGLEGNDPSLVNENMN